MSPRTYPPAAFLNAMKEFYGALRDTGDPEAYFQGDYALRDCANAYIADGWELSPYREAAFRAFRADDVNNVIVTEKLNGVFGNGRYERVMKAAHQLGRYCRINRINPDHYLEAMAPDIEKMRIEQENDDGMLAHFYDHGEGILVPGKIPELTRNVSVN
jgi:hypothetical protein